MIRAIKELYELPRLSHESRDFLYVSYDAPLRSYRETPHHILRSILQCFTDFEKKPEDTLQQFSSDMTQKTMHICLWHSSILLTLTMKASCEYPPESN